MTFVSNKLKFESIPADSNSFVNKIRISYEKHTKDISTNSCADLIDCNGLCATDEIAVMVIQELELGPNQKLLEHFKHISKEDMEMLKIYRLSPEEKAKIWLLCNATRGQHNCVKIS